MQRICCISRRTDACIASRYNNNVSQKVSCGDVSIVRAWRIDFFFWGRGGVFFA